MKYVSKTVTGGKLYSLTKSYDSATPEELNSLSMQLEKIQRGRVEQIMGHRVKKDRMGYYIVDGSTPTGLTGAMKTILGRD